MTKLRLHRFVLGLAASLLATSAGAATYLVDANANRIVGGTGAFAGAVSAGQEYQVSVALDDLWAVGSSIGQHWSNADGAPLATVATGYTDPSGDSIPTGATGRNFDTIYTIAGLTANFGSLVGSIDGAATFFELGVNSTFTASSAGNLLLFMFDPVATPDNIGTLNVSVTPVPEPAEWALLLGGIALVGWSVASKRRSGAHSQLTAGA